MNISVLTILTNTEQKTEVWHYQYYTHFDTVYECDKL